MGLMLLDGVINDVDESKLVESSFGLSRALRA